MTESAARSTRKASMMVFLLCFFTAGVPFWRIPYAELNVPNGFFGVGVAAVFIAAAVSGFFLRASFRRSLIVPALVFPAVLMARVVVEAAMEPSRHNLWPLALIIAALTGLVVAGAGAVLGWLSARVFR